MDSSRFGDSSATPGEARRPEGPVTYRHAVQSGATPGAEIARPPLPAVDPTRPRRIDRYIDYFGSGAARRTDVTADPCGESALEVLADRVHTTPVLAWLTGGEGLHNDLNTPSPWRLV